MERQLPNKEVNEVSPKHCINDEESNCKNGTTEEIAKAEIQLGDVIEQFEGVDIPDKESAAFEIPSDELVESIVKQIEYYFSDENLVKDDYLLKMIKQNKTQFVSLKIISNFKKVKKLTKDYRVVAYALEKASNKLCLDEKKLRLKRNDPLPKTTPKDFEEASRVVIATCLSTLNVDSLKEMFSQCGTISKFEVIESDLKISEEAKEILTKQVKNYKLPLALVEYDKADSASKASKQLTNQLDWRGMRVVVLLKYMPKENKLNAELDTQPKTKQPKKKKKPRVNQPIDSNIEPIGIPIPIPRRDEGVGSPKHPSSLGSSPRSPAMKTNTPNRSPRKDEENFRTRSSSFGSSSIDQGPLTPKKVQEFVPKILLKLTHMGISREPKLPSETKGFQLERTLP